MDSNHIIQELWYGNISPHTDCRPKTAAVQELQEFIVRHHETLVKKLTNAQLEILEKRDACMDEVISYNEEAIFKYAFSLGMRLAFEAFGQSFETEDT